MVNAGSDLGTVLLRQPVHAFALGEVAADDTVITFVRATFPRAVRMGIIDGQTLVALLVMLHAIAVLELRAVIHGDGLECALWELTDNLVEGIDGSGAGFGSGAEDNFKSCFTFGQCEY